MPWRERRNEITKIIILRWFEAGERSDQRE
jgi:hypothetical protein